MTLHPETSRIEAIAEAIFGKVRQLCAAQSDLAEGQEDALGVLLDEVDQKCEDDEGLAEMVLDMVESWMAPTVNAHSVGGAAAIVAAESLLPTAVDVWDK